MPAEKGKRATISLLKSDAFNYVLGSFSEWLDIHGYSTHTIYDLPNYVKEMLLYFEERGILKLRDIETLHIHQYYLHLKNRSNKTRGGGLSNAYLNKHQQAIKKFMDYLRQSGRQELLHVHFRGEIIYNTFIDVLSVAEVKSLFGSTFLMPETEGPGNKPQLFEAIAARDRAMLTVFYRCGLRRNEGYHLDLSDINFDRRILHVRKGKNYKERFVPFNNNSSDTLQTYIYDHRAELLKSGESEALFISAKGRRMNGQSMLVRLKQLQERSDDGGLKQKTLTLHTLRHSIATHLLQAGMSLEKIARFLGHSSLESTQIYTHLIDPS